MGKWVNLSKEEFILINESIKNYVVKTSNDFVIKKLNKLIVKLNKINKKIKISSAKGKGRCLQYWVCEKISKLLNIPYNQQDDNCLIHSREMGQSGSDIILRGEAGEKFPFSIECKNSETLNIVKTIEQVKNNTKKNQDWMIVHKKKALNKPIVIIEWEALERLFNK